MSMLYSASPVRSRTKQVFVQYVYIGGERRRENFEKEIVWLQESDTRIEFRHGGNVVKQGSTYTDYYGYLTSPEQAAELRRLATHYNIDQTSSLDLVAVTSVYLTPVCETGETTIENLRITSGTSPTSRRRAWFNLPDDWRMEVIVDGETLWPRLERKILGEQVTWSSRLTEADNSASLAALRLLWPVDPIDGGAQAGAKSHTNNVAAIDLA